MRVKAGGAAPPGPDPARSFDAAIAKARKEREQRRSEPAEPRRRPEPVGWRREGEPHRTAAETRSSPSPGHQAVAAGPVASMAGGARTGEPALPELREAARAVPAAIWAGRLDGAPSVELAFGRDLSVELRRGAAGIELSVRAGPSLVRAARVDLPALVQSLRARGVVVARAEVRGRSTGDGVASR